MKNRCSWPGDNELMIAYHDNEWGVPEHDDQRLFEFLILDSAQAGLSWQTILNKRENYKAALDSFDAAKIAKYTDSDRARLMADVGIVRNKLKIDSHIRNAQVFLDIQNEFGSFGTYLWNFVDGEPIINSFERLEDLPAKTPLAEEISKDLKNRGMNFVGPTIIYAIMQSCGMVNDHIVSCFRYTEVQS